MIILVDTREKVNDHIISSFDKNGISYKKKALEYGDYSFALPKNEALSIPREMYFDKKVVIERWDEGSWDTIPLGTEGSPS